ncbi:hypothetical protein [Alsobacter sp. SYSU BS001988]
MDGTSLASARAWRSLLQTSATVFSLGLVLLSLFLLTFDPYSSGLLRAKPIALQDENRRFSYPQVVRAHMFDSAVIGTSTIRLLKPDRLDAAFGAHTLNLGMNAATPWEQSKVADLFLRETPRPKLVIVGLDPHWCSPEATLPSRRLTAMAFPESFYDDDPWNDWGYLFNLRTVKMSWRLAMNYLRKKPKQIISLNGYDVFTPDEAKYDAARAHGHIVSEARFAVSDMNAPQERFDPKEFTFPALPWLEQILARTPDSTTKFVLFPPAPSVLLAKPDSRTGALLDACKAKVAEIGATHGATVVDFRYPNPVTDDETNFWDSVHYRLPIADRITDALAAARATGQSDPGGFYRVLAAPGRRSEKPEG